MTNIHKLKGETLSDVRLLRGTYEDTHAQEDLSYYMVLSETDRMIFTTTQGVQWCMYFIRSRSYIDEPVIIEDFNGDISTLIGSPILHAESFIRYQVSGRKDIDNDAYYSELTIQAWPYCKIATQKGQVTFRWSFCIEGLDDTDFFLADTLIQFEQCLEAKDGKIYIFHWRALLREAKSCLIELQNTPKAKEHSQQVHYCQANTISNTLTEIKLDSDINIDPIKAYLLDKCSTGYLDMFPWRIPFFINGISPLRYTVGRLGIESEIEPPSFKGIVPKPLAEFVYNKAKSRLLTANQVQENSND